jgi:O-antigen ligase
MLDGLTLMAVAACLAAVVWFVSASPRSGLVVVVCGSYGLGAGTESVIAPLIAAGFAGSLLAGIRGRARINLPFLACVFVMTMWAVLSYLTAGPSRLDLPGTRIGPLMLFAALLALAPWAASVRLDPASVLRVTAILGGAFVTIGLTAVTLEGGRAGALGLNPNGFGHAAAIALLAAWGLRTQSWTWPILAVCAWAVLQAGSRGAYLVVLCGLAVRHLLAGRSRVARYATVGSVAILLVSLPGVFTEAESLTVREREQIDAASSRRTRLEATEIAIQATRTHPVTGIGFRRFPEYAYLNSDIGRPVNTHNEYLRIGAETGLVGAAAFAAVLFGAVRQRPRTQAERYLKGMLAGAMLSLALANGLTVVYISGPLWLAVGALSTTSGRTMSNRRETRESGGPQTRPGASSPV